MRVLGNILRFLVVTYNGRGITVEEGVRNPGFVGDVVLANVHFKLGWRVDRIRLRDTLNRDKGQPGFVASYEPMMNDVSVSVKHVESEGLPSLGRVYPRWILGNAPEDWGGWTTVGYHEVLQLVPRAAIKPQPRVHTFRVFATGSVVQVGRWPGTMCVVFRSFCEVMNRLRPQVREPVVGQRQLTLEECMERYWRRTAAAAAAAATANEASGGDV